MLGRDNKTIIIDSADKPNPIPRPEYDPIGYDRDRNRRYDRDDRYQHRNRGSWRVYLALSIALLFVLFVSCIVVQSFIKYKYQYDTTFSSIVDISINVIVVTVTALAIGLAVAAFLFVINLAMKAGLFEMPGGVMMHVLDTLLDYRRQNTRSILEMVLGRHFTVQDQLAAQSRFRNMTTFSPSTHWSQHSNSRLLPGQLALPEAIDDVEIDVPSFADLLYNNTINSNPDEFLLGFEVPEHA